MNPSLIVPVEANEWVRPHVAAAILNRPVWTIARLARDGRIRRHNVEGCKPLYSRTDCLKLAAASDGSGGSQAGGE